MTDAPKIVQDRLRAGQPREDHPDADVLTAFAEQALSGSEREGVLRHLARCGDCREVVALGLPPLADASHEPHGTPVGRSTARSVVSSSSWFTWPTLRWAALAASVVVVASVLLLNPGKQPPPTDATVSYPAESKANVPAALTANSVATPAAKLPETSANTLAKSDHTLSAAGSRVRRDDLQPATAPSAPAQASISLADKRSDAPARSSSLSADARELRHQEPATPTPAPQGGMSAGKIGTTTETVEVSSGEAIVQTESAQVASTTNEVTAPVAKAKPALKEEADLKSQVQGKADTNLQSAYALSNMAPALKKQAVQRSKDGTAQWSLAQGKLQRSLDAGASWQVVLQLEHPLLTFGARDNDVWAGGQAGTLLHSSDRGASWAVIQPATKAGVLTSDVVAIDLRSATEIILSTSTRETWSSTDGGKTWDKK